MDITQLCCFVQKDALHHDILKPKLFIGDVSTVKEGKLLGHLTTSNHCMNIISFNRRCI